MTASSGSRALVAAAFVFGVVGGLASDNPASTWDPALAGFVRSAGIVAPAQSQTLTAQTAAEADAKSAGCITCHTATDEASMHPTGTVRLGCADCHGGDPAVRAPQNGSAGDAAY